MQLTTRRDIRIRKQRDLFKYVAWIQLAEKSASLTHLSADIELWNKVFFTSKA